jgi:peptidoglycan/LPS O-acetylase OafA/YrhL
MLGTFRFVLALLVALSHADVRVAGLNPGVVAVVCFYLISGYVMTGLIRTHYTRLHLLPFFYLDRALRIFPQYLAVAGITLLWFFAAGRVTAFLRHVPAWHDVLANLSVVPLNYFMYNGTDAFTLVPPAWSLGAEIQFYLLIPLLLLLPLRLPAFAVALVVYAAAACGLLNTDTFGYRLLPGVLLFFLLGSMLYDVRDDAGKSRLLVAGTVTLAAAASLLLMQYGRLQLPYNRETLLGLAIGLPLIYWLGRRPQHVLDNRLGDLSYGVFLNHFLLQWALLGQPVGLGGFLKYLAASILVSGATQVLIERPALHWRHGLRRKH